MSETPPDRLNTLLIAAGVATLDDQQMQQFNSYLDLLVRWNARTNLTAIRDAEGILSRHFVESIACARALPPGITTLLDFGSGAGFPGLPVALCRPEIRVTLAESQGKKAAFLSEAVRVLGLQVTVHSGRAELLQHPFDCVTLRAVDQMEKAVQAAAALVRPCGWLAPMTTRADSALLQAAAGEGFQWQDSVALPGASDRVLALAIRHPVAV
jgi:16S rRNA (guanine527-N7)-methyltransferase